MIAVFVSHWKLGGALLMLVCAGYAVHFMTARAYDRGRAAVLAEQAMMTREMTDAANRADDAARRCALDPACRLQDDGWRRD